MRWLPFVSVITVVELLEHLFLGIQLVDGQIMAGDTRSPSLGHGLLVEEDFHGQVDAVF